MATETQDTPKARVTTVTNVNPENQSSSGLPLRGLAMVLIAVAVLLAMWGLYASTQNSSDTADGAGSATSADTTAVATAPGQSASPEADRDATTTDDADTDADAADAEAREEDVEKQQPPAPRPAPAPEPERLNVLNNSTVPNLAAQVADRLREDGFEVGEVGNLADHILPETTVFFQPGNAAAEQRARELADRRGGVAREYEGFLPENTAGRNDLTLVLVNQVAL